MSDTMHLSTPQTERTAFVEPMLAPLSQFRNPTAEILFGEKLKAVKTLSKSITRHGLLSPLVVSKHNGRLIVIDGRKRLAALRRMRFRGTLPRGLVNVPYILVAKSGQAPVPAPHAAGLLSGRELYTRVTQLKNHGQSIRDIATALYLPKSTVMDVLAVTRLSAELKHAYFNGTLSLAQAKAFAALPDHGHQNMLLLALGPFAAAPDILDAIARGDTVLHGMGSDDNVVILPSRRTPNRELPKAA